MSTCQVRPPRRVRRGGRIGSVVAAAAMAAGLAGCGVGNTPAFAHAVQGRLAHIVATTVEHQYGIPLRYGAVGCHGPGYAGTFTCSATTAFSPTGDVEATFPFHPLADGRCPAVLTITLAIDALGTHTTIVADRADPCTHGIRVPGASLRAPGVAPSVTSLSPSSGRDTGATTVVITGTHLSGAVRVSFGGTAVAAFSVVSPTRITARTPVPRSPGNVDVTVTTPAGTSRPGPGARFHFTP